MRIVKRETRKKEPLQQKQLLVVWTSLLANVSFIRLCKSNKKFNKIIYASNSTI